MIVFATLRIAVRALRRNTLRTLLTEQKVLADILKARNVICPWVFHRHGKPIRDFRDAWEAACKAAACPGRRLRSGSSTRRRTR